MRQVRDAEDEIERRAGREGAATAQPGRASYGGSRGARAAGQAVCGADPAMQSRPAALVHSKGSGQAHPRAILGVSVWRRALIVSILSALPAGVALASSGSPPPRTAPLSLASAVASALRVAPQIAQAADLHRAAQYGARAGRAALLPRLSLVGGRYWNQTRNGQALYASTNGPRETVGLVELSVPLYSPQLLALDRLARDRAALAADEQAQTRLTVAAQVADAWYQLALLGARVRIWTSTVHSVGVLYRGTRQEYTVGAAAVLDLAQTRLLLHNAQSGLQQARAQRSAARRALNMLLGRSASAPLALPHLRPPERPLPMPAQWIARAGHSQPMLRVSRRQIALGRAQARSLRAARLPSLTANVGYGVDAPATPTSRDLGWQVFLGFSMPLFNFGAQRDQIADADNQVAALRAARRAVLLQIRMTIARDYGSAQAAERAYHQALKQRRDARSVYEMTRDGYKAGTLNALDLAQAESSWLQARLQVATTLALLHLAHTQLRLDAGTYPGERSAR
jgi:outer membrane protein